MVKTSLKGSRVNSSSDLLNPRIHDKIVLGVGPLDNLSVCKIRLRRVEAKRVSTTRVRGLGPHGLDGLPDELDLCDVLGWDLGHELGEVREEGRVDDGDAFEEFVVGGADGGACDEDVAGQC